MWKHKNHPRIFFSSKIRILAPYSGTTKFQFWKDVEVGDELLLTLNPVHGIYTTYAPEMEVKNLRTDETFLSTAIKIRNTYFYKMEYEIIK